MSFDIFYQPCRFGGKPVKRKNPLTGKVESVLPSEPLTTAELKAVRGVLKQADTQGPDEFGCFIVELKDRGRAEVFGSDLAEGCMVALRGLTPDIVKFLFDLLKAGNWVMCPAMEDPIAVTTSPDKMCGTPGDFPEVLTCESAEELGVLLSGGFKAWKKYRDQVVRDANPDQPGRGRK
jgi:hypothetical protein